MPIWVNCTAVVVGFILLIWFRRDGRTVRDRAFGVYLTSFAVLLAYDFLGGGSPWVMLVLLLGMAGSWICAMKRRKRFAGDPDGGEGGGVGEGAG